MTVDNVSVQMSCAMKFKMFITFKAHNYTVASEIN